MNNNECIICFEEFNENDNNMYSFECNHIECIMKWFRNGNKNCPICNNIN